jgi:hypothetical protein
MHKLYNTILVSYLYNKTNSYFLIRKLEYKMQQLHNSHGAYPCKSYKRKHNLYILYYFVHYPKRYIIHEISCKL